MKRLAGIALGLLLLLTVAVPLLAQDAPQPTAAEQKDWLVQFVEGQLSTPERQIRLSNIEGLLSEQASIRQITVSDQEGVWLEIENAALDWNQSALFGGRLEVRSLSAERIDVIRKPVPSGQVDLPPPEAGSLTVPELPVAMILERLSVPLVTFGEGIFGLGSEISVAGALSLEAGNLDAKLDIVRRDGPGGQMAADVAYRSEGQAVDLDLELSEPANGILANLFNVPDRPPMRLALHGSGPIADLRTEMSLDAGKARILSGTASIARAAAGFTIDADLRGPIASLLEEPYRPFFGAETAVEAAAVLRDEGGLTVSRVRLTGGEVAITGSAETTSDGFLRRLDLEATIGQAQGEPVTLPLPGRPTRIQSARLDVDYGLDKGGAWSAALDVAGLDAGGIRADRAALVLGGVALNLDQPARRRLTFNADGGLDGVVAADPETRAALGTRLGIGIAGLWEAGEPLHLAELRVVGDALELAVTGLVRDWTFDGATTLTAATLTPFSAAAGRPLGGSIDLRAQGTLSPLTGGFDLQLDGRGEDLRVGEAALDAVLGGDARLSGRIARTEAGLVAEGLRLATAGFSASADGRIASAAADFRFEAVLDDLAALSPQASGRLALVGTAKGSAGPVAIDLRARVPEGSLAGRSLRDAELAFVGGVEAELLSGTVSGNAMLDGKPVRLSAGVVDGKGDRRLEDLRFEAPGTSITGRVAQASDGRLSGTIEIDAPDISTAAAFALQRAAGAVTGTARIGGTVAAPRAEFDVVGSGLDAAALRPLGITPMGFAAQGVLADNVVQLSRVAADGAGGFRLAATGAVPLSGPGLDVSVTGSAPLAMGNRFVTERGGQFSGTLRLDAALHGSLAEPQFSGRVATADAGYIDPELGLRLVGIDATATLAGDRLRLDGLDAALATGGTLTGSGSVGLAAGNIADLRLRLNSARYADGDLLVATLTGDLALTGPLTRAPRLSGNVLIEEANVLVPESLGGGSALIAVDHVQPAPAVRATLARARLDRDADAAPSADLSLDLLLRAPNRVFIRGRGLDAEMGGQVKITGTIGDLRPVGAFSLHRGRLALLGQRVTFESGSVTLTGDLDPFLNLVARTEGDGITVFITVSGRASQPDIGFDSNPSLPEDEVLSRLVFNRAMGELSPLQLARLAGAAGEISGGGTSLTESLRGAAGLADLDIVTDEGGNVAVQAGQYVQENVYLGVQAGADGQSRVTVNLDITDDVRAKAAAGADGNSSIGIFYETDY